MGKRKIEVTITLDQQDIEALVRHFMINKALYDNSCITATDYILLGIWDKVEEQLKEEKVKR